jgi:hypothetical protein
MIGAQPLTPVEVPVPGDEKADGSGIEIRPANASSDVKREKLAATHLGSRQPAARK